MIETILLSLNENIGTDWATYLSLSVGIIALFCGGRWIYKKNTTSSNAQIAGRDMNINADHISISLGGNDPRSIAAFSDAINETKKHTHQKEKVKELGSLEKIIDKVKKACTKEEVKKNISYRVLREVANEGGAYDDMVRDYYAGIVLSAVRSESDLVYYYATFIKKFMPISIKVHYYLYSCAITCPESDKIRHGSVVKDSYIIDSTSFYSIFENGKNPRISIDTEITHAIANLKSEGVIESFHITAGERASYRITETGKLFYLWAQGHPLLDWPKAMEMKIIKRDNVFSALKPPKLLEQHTVTSILE